MRVPKWYCTNKILTEKEIRERLEYEAAQRTIQEMEDNKRREKDEYPQ